MKRKRLRIKSLLSSREKIACVREVDRESGIGREDEDDRATMRRLGNRENEGRKEGKRRSGVQWLHGGKIECSRVELYHHHLHEMNRQWTSDVCVDCGRLRQRAGGRTHLQNRFKSGETFFCPSSLPPLLKNFTSLHTCTP